MKKIILVSGGLDSFIAYKLYGGMPLFIAYGQRYSDKEKAACLELYGEELEILEIAGRCVELKNNYIPDRNLFLATAAAMYYYPDEIVMAGMKDDNCQDKNESAFEEYTDIISKYAKKPIVVGSPFWNTTKGEAIERYLSEGHCPSLLQKTISCYSGGAGQCLDCPACFRKYVALKSNGIETPEVSERIKALYLAKIDNYETDRATRTKTVLR